MHSLLPSRDGGEEFHLLREEFILYHQRFRMYFRKPVGHSDSHVQMLAAALR